MSQAQSNAAHPDYAQEWIIFLKRRNFILNLVWPALLVLFIISAIVAGFFYQQSQTMSLNIAIQKQILSKSESDKLTQAETIRRMEQEITSLSNEVKTLNSAREQLSLQQGDSESKLSITSQMLENLEQQVSVLKAENSVLAEQLELAKSTLISTQSDFQLEYQKLSQNHQIKVEALTKQINDRKTAYQALANRQQEMRNDIDRFSSLAMTKDQELSKLKSQTAILNSQLKEKQSVLNARDTELKVLQSNYQDTENKLNALISPIGNAGSQNRPVKADVSPRNQQDKRMTGFEEITKPKKAKPSEPTKEEEQSLDFENISILP